ELRQRMDRPENQSRVAEARQQLEKTRSEIQKAAEALENNQPSQALASGARAQKDLQQIRDDFRKKNSSQFSDEMRQMRSDARQLAEKQEEIGKQIEDLSDKKQKTLTDSDQNKELAGQLQQQRSSLTNLLEGVRDVSDKAESTEPLLARQLYETLRKASQGHADNALNMSSELLKRSFNGEAGQVEQKARGEINDLKTGIEKAAESVLGDDVESLRAAKRELDALSKQLEDELARAQGNQPGTNLQASAGHRADRSRGQPPGANGTNAPQTGLGSATDQGQQAQQAQQGQQGDQGQQ